MLLYEQVARASRLTVIRTRVGCRTVLLNGVIHHPDYGQAKKIHRQEVDTYPGVGSKLLLSFHAPLYYRFALVSAG